VVVLLLLAVFLAAIASGAPAAAEQSPRAGFSLSRKTATIGDTLTYNVSVSFPEGARAEFIPPVTSLGDFEVLRRRSVPGSSAEEGRGSSGEEWTLAAYTTGRLALPPTPVTVVSAGGDSVVLTGDTLFVPVGGVIGGGQPQLRDIKGPATIPESRPWTMALLAGAGVVALACIVYLIRRRSRKWALEPAAPAVPPHLAALERLEALLGSRLLEKGLFKEFYTELSDLLRVYLGKRFLIHAPEMTTRELAERLEYLGLPDSFRLDAGLVLEESDMVKFAKFTPGMEAALSAAKRARSLVSGRMGLEGQGRADAAPEGGASEEACR
jgi:hypothetical protein